MKAIIISAIVNMLSDLSGEDLLQLKQAVDAEFNKRGDKPNGF